MVPVTAAEPDTETADEPKAEPEAEPGTAGEPAGTNAGPAAELQVSPDTEGAPESVAAEAVAPVDEALIAEASNPATSLARLQEIAASHPEARAAIAGNPSTYPDLLTWLGQLGDPAVNEALRQRRQ